MDWLMLAETTKWYFTLAGWWNILLVALGLGFVIFVHELGHFAVAKMCGVKCTKFYIGFDVPIKLGWGKYAIRLPASLWKKTWGETTYGIGIIPLGGYVKMLGQEDNPAQAAEALRRSKEAEEARAAGRPLPEGYSAEDDYVLDPRSYMAQSVFERMAIISAGVVMNLIFAFLFAVLAFGIGVDYVPTIVAATVPGDPAWRAGVAPGDEIVEIEGTKKPRFKDLQVAVVLGSMEQGIAAVVEPYGTDERVEQLYLPDPEKKEINKIPTIGVAMTPSLKLGTDPPVVPGSLAAHAEVEFLTGDVVVAVNGERVASFVEFQAVQARNIDQTLSVTVERRLADQSSVKEGEPPLTEQLTIDVPPGPMRWFGATMKMGPIGGVQAGSPAAVAQGADGSVGLKSGDWLVSVAGEPVGDPVTLPERLRRRVGEEVELVVRRPHEGNSQELTFTTTLRDARWAPTVLGVNCPMEVPVLGICYPVESVVEQVAEGSPAARAGLRPGDVLTKAELVPANEEQIKKEEAKGYILDEGLDLRAREQGEAEQDNWLTLIHKLLPGLESDTKVKFTVQREGASKPLEISVGTAEREGFHLVERGFNFARLTRVQQAESFTDAVYLGWRETRGAVLQVYIFLKKLAAGDISPQLLGGPGTIVAVASDQAERGFPTYLVFLTLLSANLAVVNFLPIPVLDGGHMMFLLAEAVTGKPVSERVMIPLTYMGLFLILGLMLYVIGLDVQRFVFG